MHWQWGGESAVTTISGQGGETADLIMLYRLSVGAYQGSKLTHISSRNIYPQSSQLIEPLWTDPGLSVELVHES